MGRISNYLRQIFAPDWAADTRAQQSTYFYPAIVEAPKAANPPKLVVAAFLGIAAEQQAEWARRSWDGGECDPLLLCELRTRADAYRAIAETSYEGFCEQLGLEPAPESAAA